MLVRIGSCSNYYLQKARSTTMKRNNFLCCLTTPWKRGLCCGQSSTLWKLIKYWMPSDWLSRTWCLSSIPLTYFHFSCRTIWSEFPFRKLLPGVFPHDWALGILHQYRELLLFSFLSQLSNTKTRYYRYSHSRSSKRNLVLRTKSKPPVQLLYKGQQRRILLHMKLRVCPLDCLQFLFSELFSL